MSNLNLVEPSEDSKACTVCGSDGGLHFCHAEVAFPEYRRLMGQSGRCSRYSGTALFCWQHDPHKLCRAGHCRLCPTQERVDLAKERCRRCPAPPHSFSCYFCLDCCNAEGGLHDIIR